MESSGNVTPEGCKFVHLIFETPCTLFFVTWLAV